MERIQIGDEVLITGVQDKLEAAVGRTGIVRWASQSDSSVIVQFPERFDVRLHNGGIKIQDNTKRCWLFFGQKYQKFNSAPIDTGDINILL